MAHAEQALMDRLRGSKLKDIINLDARGMETDEVELLEQDAKDLYFGLLQAQPGNATLEQSRLFLSRQLNKAAHTPVDLPANIDDLALWMKANTASVGVQYRQYLAERKDGGARRYFATKSHALHFLKAVAPTKLVDGAWLYGLVSQWRDPRHSQLIRIYLEELGEGDPDLNHVLMYKRLLSKHECDQWESLDQSYFVQGAIQLALSQHAQEFLPEVIGFNLGYEQLPLHLLICAYELNELGIDPYYFTLHVTIDNAASGHAARAVQSVKDAMPRVGNKNSFYQRIRNGYQLNALGVSTNEAIAGFDLDKEFVNVLAAKASVGAALHSDYCRVGGKTVNEWLAVPGQVRGFVEALQKMGWIRRHEDPVNSRFWNLLVGEKASMFGAFNAYERQIIYDWIAGDSRPDWICASTSYRNRERMLNEPLHSQHDPLAPDDFGAESEFLRDELAKAADRSSAMDILAPWLSPVYHHTAAGLMATRMFSQRLST